MKEIQEATGASKSVISYHRQHVPVEDVSRLKLRLETVVQQNIHKLKDASRKNKENWDHWKSSERSSAAVEWESLRKNPEFLGFLAMYWSEGTKTNGQVAIVNTDPGIIKHSVEWFLKLDPEAKLAMTVRVNPDQNGEAARVFWEEAIRMPVIRVHPKGWAGKKQHSRVPYGSCVVRFNNWRVNARIGAWIDLWKTQLGVPANM